MEVELTNGSLFAGIGGFDDGAQMAGIETLWNCEIEKFNRKILLKKHPNAKQYEDIRTMRGQRYVDIICGGFPCQDISISGKGEGINGKQSGLWGEMFRVLGGGRPLYAIIENSPMLVVRGLERVLCDLSEIGYSAEWQCISNEAFGFPHKRERLYIIAYSNKIGLQGNVPGHASFEPVFREWTPNKVDGRALSKRIHEIPTCGYIRTDDGFRDWSHRVAAIGNAVNPYLAKYLFECIKIHCKKNIKDVELLRRKNQCG